MSAKLRVPTLRRHPNGQAFVEHKSIPTKSHRLYLGKYGTPESLKRYQEFIGCLVSDAPAALEAGHVLSVDELAVAFLSHAETAYGLKSKEFHHFKTALLTVSNLFGSTNAKDFGPRAIGILQRTWIAQDWSRTHINRQVGRVKHAFRWACQNEFLPPEMFHRLTCVEGLRAGKTAAREPEKVRPVPQSVVDAVLPYLQPIIAAMVQIQYLCGMRPQDICNMRGCDLVMSGPIWLYEVPEHKNAWRGQSLVKAIPKRAQAILKPFLKTNLQAHLFSPQDAEKARLGKLTARRSRKLRGQYDTDSYRKAINYGFAKAKRKGVQFERWHPSQLRHLIATEVSQMLSQQAAQRWLGHSDLETTSIYTEIEVKELIAIAQELDRRWAS